MIGYTHIRAWRPDDPNQETVHSQLFRGRLDDEAVFHLQARLEADDVDHGFDVTRANTETVRYGSAWEVG